MSGVQLMKIINDIIMPFISFLHIIILDGKVYQKHRYFISFKNFIPIYASFAKFVVLLLLTLTLLYLFNHKFFIIYNLMKLFS